MCHLPKRLILLTALCVLAAGGPALAERLFVPSARENPDHTVTLPLYRGVTPSGRAVFFILLDTSDGDLAKRFGVNRSQKLARAANTAAVQQVRVGADGTWVFPATVDFGPERQVVPDPITGFPPRVAQPGAVGEPGYSPLVQLPGGKVVNAPHVANDTGKADKALELNLARMTVRYLETDGVANGKSVRYVSTDASDEAAAALEDVTFAPALNAAPTLGDDSTASSRTSLAAFINGQTGADNPERQGLNSALLDGLDPLNVLRWTPNQGRYSPLWDVHAAQWSAAAVAAGRNVRQLDWDDVEDLAEEGEVTGPGGAPFGASGFIVNCPLISED